MISFIFNFKTAKINNLKRVLKFINSSSIIIQLYRLLLNYEKSNLFIIYTNNFFTNIKLFKYLR